MFNTGQLTVVLSERLLGVLIFQAPKLSSSVIHQASSTHPARNEDRQGRTLQIWCHTVVFCEEARVLCVYKRNGMDHWIPNWGEKTGPGASSSSSKLIPFFPSTSAWGSSLQFQSSEPRTTSVPLASAWQGSRSDSSSGGRMLPSTLEVDV